MATQASEIPQDVQEQTATTRHLRLVTADETVVEEAPKRSGRGGKREGAGRPKGSKSKVSLQTRKEAACLPEDVWSYLEQVVMPGANPSEQLREAMHILQKYRPAQPRPQGTTKDRKPRFVYEVDRGEGAEWLVYRSQKAEALRLARSAARGGRSATVRRVQVNRKLPVQQFAAACLNRSGWAVGEGTLIATVTPDTIQRRGRR